METLKLFVLFVLCIALICLKNNPVAALGESCSDSSVCNTTNSEVCDGTACVCLNTHYESGGTCEPKGVYADSCLAVDSSVQCREGLTCVSVSQGDDKCLCPNGNYYTENQCISVDVLKPTGLTSSSQTHNSVTLDWTSPSALDYTNSYVIKYRILNQREESHDVNGQDTSTTITNLSAGTIYNFIVVRTIIREGRAQTIPNSDTYQTTTKGVYADSCLAVDSSVQCRTGLSCVSVSQGDDKCLCPNGNYYTENQCISVNTLKPTGLTSPSQSNNSVTLSWTSPPAPGYTNSFVVLYNIPGQSPQTHTVNGQDTFTTVPNVNAGTIYNFIVIRTINREGRAQTIPNTDSYLARTKSNYGQPCPSLGTCQDFHTNCYELVCRCNIGYFWMDQCLSNTNLKPVGIQKLLVTPTQLRVMWEAPSTTYSAFVAGYMVDVLPNISNIIISGTTATLSSLIPGEQYTITVKTISNYLNRNEAAAAGSVSQTIVPAATEGLAQTSLIAPNIQIGFKSAIGKSSSYKVRLQNDTYDETQTLSSTGTGDLMAEFQSVIAGASYNLTITTMSHGFESAPFTTVVRVKADASDPVVNLDSSNITSRSASVSWMKPLQTKGYLYQYLLEVWNGSVCVQQVVFNCTGCNWTDWKTDGSSISDCDVIINTPISYTDLINPHYVVHYEPSLLPDTIYIIIVAAVNEEGKGKISNISLQTEQEAPGEPTNFTADSKTSNSIQLTWTPPVPRPGVTNYVLTVLEWDEDRQQFNMSYSYELAGYYTSTSNITGLSSYWRYKFEIYAKAKTSISKNVTSAEIRTDESAPTAVENLKTEKINGIYHQIKLSWSCPPKKDGQNGIIQSATVRYSTDTRSADVNPLMGYKVYSAAEVDCDWNVKIDVTAEFNYTFEVYITNSMKGQSSFTNASMEAGPAVLEATSVPQDIQQSVSSHLQVIQLTVCPSCILNARNGRVTSSGIIVCKNQCPNRLKRETKNEKYYKGMTTWADAKDNGFDIEYRATPPNWLANVKNENKTDYMIGNDTTCSKKAETAFCNGPLTEATSFAIIVFACTSAGCGESEEIKIATKESPSNLPIILGGVFGGVAAALLVVGIVFAIIYIKRRIPTTTKRMRDEEIDDEELIIRKRPVRIKDFDKRVEIMHKDSNLLFSEEFEDISTLSPKHASVASETGGNKLKNRYVNILPFDHTRVKLRHAEEDDEETDYINANYIPGYSSPREYIATQGPMTGTVNDFWRMIWEQNVPIIVMLSDLMENGKPKVDRYYPENMDPVQYGDIVLEMTNFSPLNKYVIRIFQLKVGDEVRQVRHYFLPGWKDFGANLNSDDVIDFVKDVRMEIKPNKLGPICVHCSAGVGRTGTYISLDVFQQHINEENMEKELDIFDFVMTMRQNRSYMVQTEKQYIFIHDTIKEMIIKKKKEIAERDNIYENSANDEIYINQAFETDPQDIYMNVDNDTTKPTTVL